MSVDTCRNVERMNLPSLEATTAAMSSNLGSVWPLSGTTHELANMKQLCLPFLRKATAPYAFILASENT